MGNVNSDTGIVTMMPWGVEDKGVEDRITMAIEAGVDILSGFNSNRQILDLLTSGKLSEERVDQSVGRLLTEQFQLGLFENPYVDPTVQPTFSVTGPRSARRSWRNGKSIVLLQNREGLLPLKMPTPKKRSNPFGFIGLQQQPQVAQEERVSKQLYIMGMDPEVVGGSLWCDFDVISGDYDPDTGETRPVVPAGTDYAILRVVVGNESSIGGRFLPVPDPDELDLLAFSDMAKSKSWRVSPSLEDINAVMEEIRGREDDTGNPFSSALRSGRGQRPKKSRCDSRHVWRYRCRDHGHPHRPIQPCGQAAVCSGRERAGHFGSGLRLPWI